MARRVKHAKSRVRRAITPVPHGQSARAMSKKKKNPPTSDTSLKPPSANGRRRGAKRDAKNAAETRTHAVHALTRRNHSERAYDAQSGPIRALGTSKNLSLKDRFFETKRTGDRLNYARHDAKNAQKVRENAKKKKRDLRDNWAFKSAQHGVGSDDPHAQYTKK